MKLTAVVAVSDNDVIGSDNTLPWYQPADLAHFKKVTMGKPILMGRRTYESIGRSLPGRLNLVLSRRDFSAPGVEGVHSVEEACQRAAPAEELMVIGGAEVFKLVMPLLDAMHLTRVHCTLPGDTFMPDFDVTEWREVSSQFRPADERNVYPMTFIELQRTTVAAAS